MLKCTTCTGRGKVASDCKTCGSKGWTDIDFTNGKELFKGYACHDCGNLRCVKCGGEGFVPSPPVNSIGLRSV
jgi:hypothetical protein